MHYTFIAVAAAAACLVIPAQAEAQPRKRQTLGEGRPLVLRVTPRRSRDSGPALATRYGRVPWYLVDSPYEPRNPFDPIELAPPLGLGANNIAITLPVTSANCSITQANGMRYASPGCLSVDQ